MFIHHIMRFCAGCLVTWMHIVYSVKAVLLFFWTDKTAANVVPGVFVVLICQRGIYLVESVRFFALVLSMN